MSLFKFGLAADKAALIRRELGQDAAAYFAAMQVAEAAFFRSITTEQNQLQLSWLQMRTGLITRLDDSELAKLNDYSVEHAPASDLKNNKVLRRISVVTQASLHAAMTDISSQAWLGFDTETAATFEKGRRNTNPISLIQIATASHCYLFRMIDDNIAPFQAALQPVLSGDKQLKVGIGLRGDINAMKRDFEINMTRILDLNWLMNQLGAPKQMGTQQIAAAVLRLKLPKSKKVTLSNWAKPLSEPLSELQLQYAAADTLVALDILHQLINQLRPYQALWPQSLQQRLTEYVAQLNVQKQ